MPRYLVTRVRREFTTAFVYAEDEDKAEEAFDALEEKGEVEWDANEETEIEEHEE